MKLGYVTSKKERIAYCLFFLGQNILWGYAGYVETFLTDIGITAAAAAAILLAPKLWDAVNDVLFGYLVDRHVFKNGQISQAEAKKYFIERMRVNRPDKTGIIWWNLLDGWPQMSDAVVDYYFTKKLSYHYIKRSQAPFVIAADEINHWNLGIYACNDTLEVKKGSFTVEDPCAGQILYEGCFTAKENASTRIAQLPTFYSEQKILIFKWEANGEEGFNHYLCGYPPISLEMYKKVLENYGL